MPTVKQFLVGAIGLVITLVIIGTGVGVYKAVKPVADFATEGVNTLAGEMTSEYYKYNGKTMTGQQIIDDVLLKKLIPVSNTIKKIDGTAVGSSKTDMVTGNFKETAETPSDPLSNYVKSNATYSITVNWDSASNTFDSITVKQVNQ